MIASLDHGPACILACSSRVNLHHACNQDKCNFNIVGFIASVNPDGPTYSTMVNGANELNCWVKFESIKERARRKL